MAFNASPSPDEPTVSPAIYRTPVKYHMTFWRAFNRLNWKWLPWYRYIRETTSILWKRLYESTDVRDEIYNLFPSLSLSLSLSTYHPFPLFSHFHTSPQLFLPSFPFSFSCLVSPSFRSFIYLTHFLSSFGKSFSSFLALLPRDPISISLSSIFAHSLMRHIVSCAGGNDDDDDEEKQNWTREHSNHGWTGKEEEKEEMEDRVKIMSWIIF